jgi:Zn-dependent protease
MKIDFSFYFAILLALFSRQIDVYLTYLIAITIHECGHLLFASLFKWEVEEFRMSAIGGFLTFKNDLGKPALQTFLVATGGIIFNLIFALILFAFNGPPSLIYTQFAIALFNLLPIAPLDGSKMLQSILRGIFEYKTVLNIMKFTNVIFLFIFALGVIAFRWEQYFIVVVVLGILVGKFQAQVPYIYQRYKIQTGSNYQQNML